MNKNIRDLKKKNLMYSEGYIAVKSPVCVKTKSKIAHNFFVTKATDLNFIFEKPLKIGYRIRNMCHTLIFVLKLFTLFLAFFLPSLAPK